ncbi:hypothetical protein RFI_40046, partial [Reticulomyxa filosa]
KKKKKKKKSLKIIFPIGIKFYNFLFLLLENRNDAFCISEALKNSDYELLDEILFTKFNLLFFFLMLLIQKKKKKSDK